MRSNRLRGMFLVASMFLSSMLLSLAVFAQDGKEEVVSEPIVSETIVPSDSDHSSAAVRARSHASAGARAGLMFSLIPGIGLEGSWIQSKNLQVGGLLAGGGLDLSEMVEDEGDDTTKDKVKVSKATINAAYIGAFARWFVLNSFYLSGGLGLRTINTDLKVESRTNSSEFIAVKTNSDSFSLDLGIGNIWTFGSGLYIGAEWFGATIPLSSNYDSDVEVGGTPSKEVEKQASDAEDLAKDLSKMTSYKLAVFHIGWTF